MIVSVLERFIRGHGENGLESSKGDEDAGYVNYL